MSLIQIAWRSVQQRGLASVLTMLSMALGVGLCVAVLLGHGVLDQSFRNNAYLGYNLIVGANKGGKLQLVLNTVYYLSQPVENIPYEFYLEFLDDKALSAELSKFDEEQQAYIRGKLDPNRNQKKLQGAFGPVCEFAVPVCLGDYYEEFRVIGTNSRMFEVLRYDQSAPRNYAFALGRNIQDNSPEFGKFEAVVGAAAARKTGLAIGDTFSPVHGIGGHVHKELQFHIVGILAPTGTPIDRGVFVNMEGFYLVNDHARPLEEVDPKAAAEAKKRAAQSPATSAEPPVVKTLPVKQREVTAVLVLTKEMLGVGLDRVINKGSVGQAVWPSREIYSFLSNFISPIQLLLLTMTILICVVSGISILVSIFNSMSERKHEIAVMRALGAGRGTVMSVILLEAIILALGGGGLGWLGGHVLIASLSPWIEAQTGVAIHLFDFAPAPQIAVDWLGESTIIKYLSPEFLLIPGLTLLAILVGFLPALSAYRTDVARSLGK